MLYPTELRAQQSASITVHWPKARYLDPFPSSLVYKRGFTSYRTLSAETSPVFSIESLAESEMVEYDHAPSVIVVFDRLRVMLRDGVVFRWQFA